MLRYLGRVISLCLLCIAGMSAPSYAQEPKVLCPEGQELDPYEIWSDVNNEEEAKQFLRAQYGRFQSPIEFATWLSCQGFEVAILNGPFGSVLKPGELKVWAGFLIAPIDRPALWGASWLNHILKKHAHTIDIYIDKNEKIFRIIIGMTFK
ncbi:MAG: hypothetical protein WDZ83_14900 [Rhizobiaceae bacterium]